MATSDERIAAIRRFNRYYTRLIGVLREKLSRSPFSLTEARVLYELALRPNQMPSALCELLDLDPGYLSRIINRFVEKGLVIRTRSERDGRSHLLALTQAGQEAFAPLDAAARQETAAMLAPLPEPAQDAVVANLGAAMRLLGAAEDLEVTFRGHEPGDIGWVVERHGALYAQEYGFDHRFEALVATVAGVFLAKHDPVRERCWIVERGGTRVGSAFVVAASDDLAKLRLVLVEPAARGLGIGKQLVATSIGFARQVGYQRMTLWTNDVLEAARAIYRQAGFRMVASKPHDAFGPAIVGEDWELSL